MKNTAIITLFLIIISLASCKRAYECVCEDGKVVNEYLEKYTKSEAKDVKTKCEAQPTCVFQKNKNN
jgi:hypothetical protein